MQRRIFRTRIESEVLSVVSLSRLLCLPLRGGNQQKFIEHKFKSA